MFIPCRSFDKTTGDFAPVDVVVNPATVCLASQFVLELQRDDVTQRLLLVKIALVSGEIITVESTLSIREALNLPMRGTEMLTGTMARITRPMGVS